MGIYLFFYHLIFTFKIFEKKSFLTTKLSLYKSLIFILSLFNKISCMKVWQINHTAEGSLILFIPHLLEPFIDNKNFVIFLMIEKRRRRQRRR